MEVRQRILEVAIAQFARFGVRTITMEDLARQVGVSKKTIYQEFEDKKDLVKAVFETILIEDTKRLDFISGQLDGVIEHLVNTSKMMRERLTSINPLVILEIQNRRVLFFWKNKDILLIIIILFIKIIKVPDY